MQFSNQGECVKKYINIWMMVFALFITGCGGSQPEVVSYPSWYMNPPQNNGSFLYGVGEGYTLDSAKAAALSSVSQSLSLTVSSELKKHETSTRNNGSESTYTSVVSNLKAQAKEMEFSDYSITQNQQIGSKFILLIEVSRVRLFNDQKVKLDRFLKELKEEKKRIEKEPVLKQALLYKKRALKKASLKSMALLTKTINSGFNTKIYIQEGESLENEAIDALNKVRVSISSSKDAGIFKDIITQGFNEVGIKTSSSNGNTKVYLKNTFQTDEIYGFKIAKASFSISTKQNSKLIASNSFSLTGKSKYAYDKAKYAARRALQQKIKKEGIFSVLGFK